ncbi:Nn.00g074170.m01.CDS01 [Neocucurbitaria sp. VM-36]
MSDTQETPQKASQPAREEQSARWAWPSWSLSLWRNPENVPDGRFNDLHYESIGSYRVGYPHWAAYQNSDPSFKIYKRYGTLRNRVILYRQQEIAQLEEELNRLDEEDHKSGNGKTRSLLWDQEDADSKRMKLIDQIEEKLKRYDDLLERELRIGLLEKPSPREYRSLVNYIYNNKPVIQDEAQFLKYRDDFVQLTAKSESPLESLLVWVICRIPIPWVRRQFASESQMQKMSNDLTILISPRKVFILARGIASFLAIGLISIPLFIMASDSFSEKIKLVALLVSLVAFPFAIQIAARPRNLELFMATATYCAVLSTLLAVSSPFDLADFQRQLLSRPVDGTTSS